MVCFLLAHNICRRTEHYSIVSFHHRLPIGGFFMESGLVFIFDRLPGGRILGQGIDFHSVFDHLEMDMRAGGIAGRADIADDIALFDLLPHPDIDLRLVGVVGGIGGVMPDAESRLP